MIRALRQQFGNLSLMRVADHHGNTRKLGDLFGRTLRITTCNDDPGLRIFAMDTADDLAHLVVRGIGDGAGVQDDELGRRMLSARV